MDEQPVISSEYDSCPSFCRGSAWAELDETFFQLVQDCFSHTFCQGASALLASNDDLVPEQPDVIQLPETDVLELDASMRRHPSSRRRF